MIERMPVPGEYQEEKKDEQIEMFEEDELVDPDMSMKKLLEFIKEEDKKAELRRKEKKEKEKKKRKRRTFRQ